jgi:RNA polymerase sigma-70 factor (ECF subfamily)
LAPKDRIWDVFLETDVLQSLRACVAGSGNSNFLIFETRDLPIPSGLPSLSGYGIVRAYHFMQTRPSKFGDDEIAMVPLLATLKDSALIELALAGQTECFAVLTNRHLPAVRRRIGLIVPCTTDADDVLQESLLKVWCHLSTFRSESNFRTWMTRVAINEALQSYRRSRKTRICQALIDLDTFASPNESPVESLTRAETTRIVRRAVVELPAKYRQAVALRYLGQHSLIETAQWLHSSVTAMKSRLFRARLMVSAALQRPENPE